MNEVSMVRNRKGPVAAARTLIAGATGLLPALALARVFTFQDPVTEIARQQIGLHNFIMWICVFLLVVVFVVMLLCIF